MFLFFAVASHRIVKRYLLAALMTTVLDFPVSLGQESSSTFVRFVEGNEQWQGRLQTSISSYKNKSGITLNLVSAIHIADQPYYQSLNRYFSSQDAVLYELVAEPDQRPALGSTADAQAGASPVSFMQRAMASFLKVGFQLEHIDYNQSNFRHADVSPSQLNEIMRSKNGNAFSMFLSLALAQSIAQTEKDTPPRMSPLVLMQVLMTDERQSAAKYLLAKELANAEISGLSQELEDQLTILGDRNRAALEVLKTSLMEPGLSQISLFYGAAHMPGLERAIVNDFGFFKVNEQWLDAWIIP